MARVLAVTGIVLVLMFAWATEVLAQPPQPAGRVLVLRGRVEIERAGAVRAAAVRQDVFAGDVLRTGADGYVTLLLADESRVKLNANSILRIKAVAARPARGVVPAALRVLRTLVELLVGEIWVQSPGRPDELEIETPVVTGTIKGTEFVLRVAPDGESQMLLLEGRVELGNELGTLSLRAGEAAIARRGQPPSRRVVVTPEDAVQWILHYPGIFSVHDYPLVSADRGRLEGLLTDARAELAAAPGDLDRQARVAEVLRDLGRRDEARAAFAAILSARADAPRALGGLGWIALGDGRVDEAIGRFTAIAAPTPSSLLGLSLARFRRGDLVASAATADEAARRFGPSPGLLTHGALLSLLAGDVARSRQALDEALRLDPGFALAHGLRSNIALAQNRKDEAWAHARRAVEANPRSPSAHLDAALVHQARFDLDAALDSARTAVSLDPANGRTHVQLARVLFGLDRLDEARRSAELAVRLAPGEPLVLSTLGFVRLARGDTGEAISAFTKALDAGDTSGDAYLGLGLAAFRQRRIEEGLRFFQSAVAVEPRVSLFHSYLAKALHQVGRREEALAALDRARMLDPRDPTPELYRAVMLRDQNRPAEAIESLQRSVELNDNRAIYRSRFLLDRDLASRNVNLALAYLDLGQTERALAAGIRAIHEDPQSSSAHLFYGAVVGLGLGAFQPGLSELLQTRILVPVNQNTFNTFNDYTMLLEQPSAQGTVEVRGGSFGTFGTSVTVTGGTPRIAAEQFGAYARTDGPKPANDDDESWTAATFVKWAATLRSSLYLQLFHQETKGGDIFLDQRHFTGNDSNLRRNAEATFVELGYQLQPIPESHLWLYAQGQHERFRIRDRDTTPGALPPFTLQTEQDRDLVVTQSFYDTQAAYLHRVGTHQLWFAADYFSGEPRTRLHTYTVTDAFLFGVPVLRLTSETVPTHRFRRQYVSLAAQDTWQPWRGVYLTGALRYDDARDGDTLSELRYNSHVWSPQGGLLWRVTPDHTVRLAAFKAFQPQAHTVLSPTHLAGFFIDAPLQPSSVIRQYHAAWDADLTRATFVTLGAFRREFDSPEYETRPDGSRGRTIVNRVRTGASAAVNQILWNYVGLSLGWIRVHREGPAEHDGDDDLIRGGVNFVHPTGFSAAVSATYVHQSLGTTKAPGAPRTFWVASAGPAYEFPDKRGNVSVTVENVFRERFDLRSTPGVRNDLVLSEVPDLRVIAALRVNF